MKDGATELDYYSYLVMSCYFVWEIKVKDVAAIWVVLCCVAEKKRKKYMSKSFLNIGKLDCHT